MSAHELIVDSFAGGGGASLGIEMALGRSPDIAINHDAEAIAMHQANHPTARHYQASVWDVDPIEACAGRSVGLMWLSPDCTFHSKARGAKPFRERDPARRRRGLAWVAVRWAKAVRPRVIALENVEEFADWGPLAADGKPCPLRRGLTFRRFVKQLQNCGYEVDWQELRACDYGAPTTRKRLFLIARCDGLPIVWPEPTHGYRLLPYRTAAECVIWTLPCPSIFERSKPLADNTLRRVARGIRRFVVDDPNPFIVRIGQTGGGGAYVNAIDSPLTTITTKAEHCLVAPFLAKHYGGNYTGPGVDVRRPMDTITTTDHHALVHAFLVAYYGNERDGGSLNDPMRTLTTKDRYGLVTIHGQQHRIADIGMRMLQPRELFRAQGFPDRYVIDLERNGKPLSKAAQVRMCGNSVCPPVAAAIVQANMKQATMREAA